MLNRTKLKKFYLPQLISYLQIFSHQVLELTSSISSHSINKKIKNRITQHHIKLLAHKFLWGMVAHW